MNEQGLAAAYAAEDAMRQGMSAPAPMQQGQPQPQQGPMVSVEELVMMLKQGITPEELAQQGVPPELIDQALMMLQQEIQQGQIQPQAPQGGGLADMYAAQGSL